MQNEKKRERENKKRHNKAPFFVTLYILSPPSSRSPVHNYMSIMTPPLKEREPFSIFLFFGCDYPLKQKKNQENFYTHTKMCAHKKSFDFFLFVGWRKLIFIVLYDKNHFLRYICMYIYVRKRSPPFFIATHENC